MKRRNRKIVAYQELKKLSTSEIFAGILLNIGDIKFPEQAVYKFFEQIGSYHPMLLDRFCVNKSLRRYTSEPLRKVLSFFEMGKLLELPLPNPVDQYYRPRISQMPTLKHELEYRSVLSTHEKLLEQLAKDFKVTIEEYYKNLKI